MTENGPVTSAGHKDEDHAQFGGFPVFEAATPAPGFGEFLTGMRRLQDLAVSTDPDDDTWDAAAQQVNALVQVLEPYRCGEGVGPAGRTPKLPGAGNLLMPEWKVTRFDSDGVRGSRVSARPTGPSRGRLLPAPFPRAATVRAAG